MSLQTPKTIETSNNIVAQLEASLNQNIPLLPISFSRVLAKVLAGLFILLYKYGGFIFLQLFVESATIKETIINGRSISPLKAIGRLIGAPDPGLAGFAEYIIDITVTNQTGSLPSGTQLVNSNNGVTYLTIGAILLNAPIVQATIRAASDQTGGNGSGTVGNLNAADVVSFAESLGNVSRDAVVATELVTGTNAEETEVYRTRVSNLLKKRPQGGAYADYETWSLEVNGIINAFPYTGNNPGQVDVYIESFDNVDGIPTPAQLQAVLDNINTSITGIARNRPALALVNTIAITRQAFDVTVSGLNVDNLADVQAQIQTAVTEYFLAAYPFVDGLTVPPRSDNITRSAIIGIVNDIVTASNGTFLTATFVLTSGGLDLESYILQQGEESKLGNPVVFV